MDIRAQKNKNWIENEFFSKGYYRFRSCVVAMSGCLLDMIDKKGIELRPVWNEVWKDKEVGIESVTRILANVRKLPLRFSKGMQQEYVNIIWQLVNPWEGIKKDTSYYTFLKTTRNWIAHRHITEMSLQIAAFFFGLSLRGLFDFVHVDASVKLDYDEYKIWEEELLKLIQIEDDKNNDFDFKDYMFSKLKSVKKEREKKEFSWLTIKSFQCFMWRYKKYVKDSKNQYPINKDIFSIIHDLGENNKENKENKDVVVVIVTDLIREFLHDLYSISIVKSIGKFEESNKIAYKFTYKSEDSSISRDRIEIRYLEHLHKTLQKAIEDEDEKRAKEEENINKGKIK